VSKSIFLNPFGERKKILDKGQYGRAKSLNFMLMSSLKEYFRKDKPKIMILGLGIFSQNGFLGSYLFFGAFFLKFFPSDLKSA
jgi:hypothetical protein